MEFLPEIKRSCNSVINITTGAGLGMTIDQRLEAAESVAPEVASMNMGSLNFNISAAASSVPEFKHAWEKPYLENTKDFILTNTFTQIEQGIERLSKNGTRFEFECYDIGHLYNLKIGLIIQSFLNRNTGNSCHLTYKVVTVSK
tara:strand:+ start:504 stop:935 length:432 start_codon:yes stop_codon:yes gene_type:complete